MRDRKYVTMMDPFQLKYGDKLTGLLSVVVLMSEVIWVTSTLISLGNLKPYPRTLCLNNDKI